MLPTLLNPALVWLLPLAAAPVILHLLTLQRLRTVELSTFRFLFDSYVQQRRQMQFMQALLAFLRTLFLLLLILAACRPVIQNWAGLFRAGSGREVLLLVDCSASMGAKALGQSALDRAKDAARAVVARLHPDDRVTLVRVAGRPTEVFSRFRSEQAAIEEALASLASGPGRGNLYAALASRFGPDARPPVSPLVYFFTDAQASSWRELSRQREAAAKLLPAGTPVVVVRVGGASGANLAVTGDPPPRQRAVLGLPVRLTARVANYGPVEAEATVRLVVNDREVPAQRATLKLAPGEERVHAFAPYEPAEAGTLRGRFEVSLSGQGADAFPEDDRYLFALPVEPKVRVLLVNGNPSADPFESETLYARAALAAERKADAPPAAGAAAAATAPVARSLEVSEVGESALSVDAVAGASVIVLANVSAVSPEVGARLRDHVVEGGGLLVFPGDRLNADAYHRALFNPGGAAEPLTLATFGQPVGDPANPGTFARIARVALDHPVFSAFAQADAGAARYFDRVYLKRRHPLDLSKAPRTSVLMETADRAPALVQSRFGEGVLVLAGFPLNAKWGNLPLSGAEFVPMMLRLVSFAQARPDAEGPAAVPPDGAAEFSVTGRWAPVAGRVTDPLGRPTALAFERAGVRQTAVFDATSARGYYAAEVRPERDGSRAAELLFAVNLAADESDPRPVAEAEARELLPSADLTLVDATAEAQQERGGLGGEQEVWQPLIWAVFLIIGCEFFLSTLRGGRAPGEEEGERDLNPARWVGRMTGG